MKKCYRFFLLFIDKLLLKIHVLKTWIFEWKAIYEKSNQYKHIKWSKSQQKEFDDYWKKYYGKRISNRWHKLYESSNGIFNIRYFPEILFSTKVEVNLNSLKIGKVLEDKSFVDLLYKDIYGLRIPKTYIINSSGVYYDENKNILKKKEIKSKLINCGEVVIKPTIGSSSGNNVRLLTLKNSVDIETGETIESILEAFKENFIIQKKLHQHKDVMLIYPYSINTIRIITYILNDEIFHCPLTLRVGRNGSKVDNIHSGGIAIGICDNGKLKEYGYDNENNIYKEHPNTNIIFKDFEIPNVFDVIKLAYKAHGKTPHIGVVSWDFMIDDENIVNLIEANIIGQSLWFPQITNSLPAFGENTEKMIEYIVK